MTPYALAPPILPYTVPSWIISRSLECVRLFDLRTGILGPLEILHRDHRLPEDDLAVVGAVDERVDEREGILELGRLGVEQVIPHARHHGADVDVSARYILGRDRTDGNLEVAAIRQLATAPRRDGLDPVPIPGMEVKVEVRLGVRVLWWPAGFQLTWIQRNGSPAEESAGTSRIRSSSPWHSCPVCLPFPSRSKQRLTVLGTGGSCSSAPADIVTPIASGAPFGSSVTKLWIVPAPIFSTLPRRVCSCPVTSAERVRPRPVRNAATPRPRGERTADHMRTLLVLRVSVVTDINPQRSGRGTDPGPDLVQERIQGSELLGLQARHGALGILAGRSVEARQQRQARLQ